MLGREFVCFGTAPDRCLFEWIGLEPSFVSVVSVAVIVHGVATAKQWMSTKEKASPGTRFSIDLSIYTPQWPS